jgi:anthranilate synthase component 1
MDQALAIRTLWFEGDRYSFRAGAGIVADSVPEREHDEVLAKGRALGEALRVAKEEL